MVEVAGAAAAGAGNEKPPNEAGATVAVASPTIDAPETPDSGPEVAEEMGAAEKEKDARGERERRGREREKGREIERERDREREEEEKERRRK